MGDLSVFYAFAFNQFYPGGGANDFVGFYTSLEAALEAVANKACDEWHICNAAMVVIRKGKRDA